MMKTNNKKKGNTAKKLIPAAMMLAVSASMLGTSTYAWFSMNKTVSVASMSIAAKSADPIIEISANGSDFYNSLTTAGTPNWTLPSSTGVALKLVTPTAISTASGSEGTVSWGWASSTAHDNAQKTNATSAVSLTAQSTPAKTESNRAAYLGDGTDLYVLTQKLTIRNVSPDVTATNLTISDVNIDKGTNSIGNAVRVLFVAEDGTYALYEPSGSGDAAISTPQWLTSSNSSAMTVTSGIPTVAATLAPNSTGNDNDIDVDVYVFFDGTDDDAYTDKATNLSAVSVDFAFAIS